MKRQRPHADITLEDVKRFLRNSDLDQLREITEEIAPLYASKISDLVMNFPPELWFQILEKVPPPPASQEPPTPQSSLREDPMVATCLRFWLSARLVCKTWCSSISKLDLAPFIHLVPFGFKQNNVLRLFNFRALQLCTKVDVALLTRMKSLTLTPRSHGSRSVGSDFLNLGSAMAGMNIFHMMPFFGMDGSTRSLEWFTPQEFQQFTMLTQLTSLHLSGSLALPSPVLLQMTSLKSLRLDDVPPVPTIWGGDYSPLTNLETLVITFPQCTSSSFEKLTQLKDLICDEPMFFQKGHGTCFYRTRALRPLKYTGTWSHGMRHGTGSYEDCQSFYLDGRKNKYVGEWVEDHRHGHGVMNFQNGDYYDGAWQSNEITGEGLCIYADGSCYQGLWLNGYRHGTGTYTFKNGTVLEGEWAKNYLECEDAEQKVNQAQAAASAGLQMYRIPMHLPEGWKMDPEAEGSVDGEDSFEDESESWPSDSLEDDESFSE